MSQRSRTYGTLIADVIAIHGDVKCTDSSEMQVFIHQIIRGVGDIDVVGR